MNGIPESQCTVMFKMERMDELLERAVKTAEARKISNEPFKLSDLFSR